MAAEKNATSCRVCLEIFNDPRCLRCGHSFCLKCIKGVAGNKQMFPCPICRVRVDLRDGKVDELPKNFVLCDVIEAKDMTQLSTCLEHKKLLDMYCEGCDMVICSKCLSTKHKGHIIGDIDEIFIDRNEKLSAFLVATKTWASMIQKKRDFVETSRKSIQNPYSIKKRVENTFKKWYDHLHEQQNTIMSKLLQERDKKLQVCDEAQRILKSCTTKVTVLETEINIIRSKGTACVVQQFGSARKRQEDTERKILLDMKTCFTSPGDSKIEICAPWIEEAIDNITLTDMVQKEAKHQPPKIAMILTENINMKRENGALVAAKQEQGAIIQNLRDENKALKQLNKHLNEKENGALVAAKQEQGAIIQILQDENKAFKQLNKRLNEKLNEMAGTQMTHNNPNITDLCDADRPSNISQEYMQLYDNEWFEAFEELAGQGGTEQFNIKSLLDRLMECCTFCKTVSGRFSDKLEKSALTLPGLKSPNKCKDIPVVCKRQLQDMKKSFGVLLMGEIKELYWSEKNGKQEKQTIQNYINKCIDLCWLMKIQEPPVVIDNEAEISSSFDTDKYRAYAKTGTEIDFVVLPPLRLHEGGALLIKGLAQGKD